MVSTKKKVKQIQWRCLLALLLILALSQTQISKTHAANIIVNTTVDVIDANGGSCTGMTVGDLPGADNVTSLREAICAANGTTGADTITFADLAGSPNIYTLSITGVDENVAATGDLDVTQDLTIIGNGVSQTIIEATGLGDRVFQVHGVATDVAIQDLTITGGTAPAGTKDDGGGLDIPRSSKATFPKVTVERVIVDGNTAVGNGGGLSNDRGTLIVRNSIISNNSSTGHGGGISSLTSKNVLVIEDSLITKNKSLTRNGGGIFNSGNTGVATIQGSTLSNNEAKNRGGGGQFNTNAIIENTTFSGNKAGSGGGLYAQTNTTTPSLNFVTITNNQSNDGGGVRISGSNLNFKNTIIAGNIDTKSGTNTDDCRGTTTSEGNNLTGSGTGCITGTGGDITTTPAGLLLGPLTDNGVSGPAARQTHLPQAASPAVNAGSNTDAPTTDGRGVPRISGGTADIGAVERQTLEQPFDFGDVPASYGTVITNSGASHVITSSLSLGPTVDGEADGLPSTTANGDDNADSNDEDGVTNIPTFVAGTSTSVTVHGGPSGGQLDGWIDYDGNGVFDHPAEHINSGTSVTVSAGAGNVVNITVPGTVTDGTSYARFRLSTAGGLTPTGAAKDGEVEDYQVTIIPPVADLSISQSDTVDPIVAGNILMYTVTVTNVGPSTANNVVVTDTLPAGVTFISTNGCAEDPNGVPTCSLGDISASSSDQFTVSVMVDAATSGPITNQVDVASDTTDPNTSSNSVSQNTTVNPPPPDLGLSNSVDNPTPRVGQTVTYTVVVNNAVGSGSTTSVLVSDTLPSGLTFVSATPSSGSYNSGSGLWTLSNLSGGSIATLTLQARVNSDTAGQTIINTAVLSSSTPADATPPTAANAALTVQSADLEIGKFVSAPGIPLIPSKSIVVDTNDVITYTIAIINNGPDAVPAGTIITDSLPKGVTYLHNNQFGVATVDTSSLPEIAITLNAMTSTRSLGRNPQAVEIIARVNAGTGGQQFVNTAQISSFTQGDPVAVNNTSAVTVTVRGADLALSKTVSNATPSVGETITYTVVVVNNGPDPTSGVIISDTFPAQLTFDSSSTTSGSYSNGIGIWTVNDATFTTGEVHTLTLQATVSASALGQTIINTATVSQSMAEDGGTANNTASVALTVPSSDLSITKSSTRDNNALPNGVINYTLTVQNNGPTAANNAVVSDPLPTGITGFTWSCAATNGAVCANANGSGALNETLPTFPANGQLTYSITAPLAIADAIITNTAVVTTATGTSDPSPGNNTALDTSQPSSNASLTNIYLPMVIRNTTFAPDLVVDSVTATVDGVTVVIKNQGNAPVVDAFWVDIYFNPSQVPEVNMEWDTIASQGGTWGIVGSDLPIDPGQSLVLTLANATLGDNLTSLPPYPAGATIYALVDAIDFSTTYGAVQESDETNNLAQSTVSAVGSNNAPALPAVTGQSLAHDLPSRR